MLGALAAYSSTFAAPDSAGTPRTDGTPKTDGAPKTNPDSQVNVKVYGFVKGEAKYATDAVTFFGTEGVRKPNYAKRQTEADDDTSRFAFQANQSRVGVLVKAGQKATATIETDFDNTPGVDNTAVSDYLRLRQAFLTYSPTTSTVIFAGKTWDLFSPLVPKTYNITSILYGTGNVGWIRDQLGGGFSFGDVTLKAAVGNVSKDGDFGPNKSLVHNSTPAATAQLSINTGAAKFYFSGIAAQVLYRDDNLENTASLAGWDPNNSPNLKTPGALTSLIAPDKVRRFAGGLAFSFEAKVDDSVQISGEAVRGTNLGDLYALGVSKMTAKTAAARLGDTVYGAVTSANMTALNSMLYWTDYQSTHELSGWINMGLTPSTLVIINLFAGVTRITNPENLASASGDLTVSGGAKSPGDVEESHLYGFNFGFKLSENVLLYFEFNYLRTIYHESERTKGDIANFTYNHDTGTVSVDVKNPLAQAGVKAGMPGANVTQSNYYNFYSQRAAPRAVAQVYNVGAMFKF